VLRLIDLPALLTWQSSLLRLANAVPDGTPFWPLSDGEVHYFYWFIRGSIMIPETRWHLRRSWGFCERHGWAHLAVEMAFRRRFLLGPAILYDDLLGRAADALAIRGPLINRRLVRRLRPNAPCLMCELGAFWAGSGATLPSVIRRGRSTTELCNFAAETYAHWKAHVCGVCDGRRGEIRCRAHLLQELARGSANIPRLRDHLVRTQRELIDYRASLTWVHTNTGGPQASAALVAAVGWLNGWRPLLCALGGTSNSCYG
jgi:hypothetical protein